MPRSGLGVFRTREDGDLLDSGGAAQWRERAHRGALEATWVRNRHTTWINGNQRLEDTRKVDIIRQLVPVLFFVFVFSCSQFYFALVSRIFRVV